MSITFWCPDAGTREVQNVEDDGEVWTDTVSNLPEVNFANANAYKLLDLLNQPVDSCGSWPVEKLPEIEEQILAATVRMAAERPGELAGYWASALLRLHAVVVCGKQAGFAVGWG